MGLNNLRGQPREPRLAKCRCLPEWSQWVEPLSLVLHADNRWRLLVLMTRMLFAQVRRTVARWLRAARIKSDVSNGDDFVSAVGKHVDAVAGQRLTLPDEAQLRPPPDGQQKDRGTEQASDVVTHSARGLTDFRESVKTCQAGVACGIEWREAFGSSRGAVTATSAER